MSVDGEMSDLAKITVQRPKGCERKALSIHAMDKNTRDLAWKTFLYADGKPLLCESFALTERGTLMVEVKAECFEVGNQV